MAGSAVNSGMSTIKCSYGSAAVPFFVENASYMVGETPGGTIGDAISLDKIPSFVMCMSMDNPMMEAATAAALGVLTPMPCIPVTAPWAPGMPTILLEGMHALDSSSKCLCCWGGEITALTVDTVELS